MAARGENWHESTKMKKAFKANTPIFLSY